MNIYDIARLAGVSTATVSRVLNHGKVKAATRDKVMEVIAQTTYTPNVFARGLNRNSMSVIAVVVSDIADIYFANAVSIIEKELKSNGYDLILYCAGSEPNTERYLELLSSKKTDGIIFVGSKFKNIEKTHQLAALAGQTPVVMLNCQVESKSIYSIVNDDKTAVREAVRYLFEQGHRQFLYLYDMESPSGKYKLEGFRTGLAEHGLEARIIHCPRSIELAKREVLSTYKQGAVTAIVTAQDELAVGALKAAAELHLDVPRQLAVTGYNNSILATSCSPELTSIDNKLSVLCELSVKVMVDALNGKPSARRIVVECEMVKRAST